MALSRCAHYHGWDAMELVEGGGETSMSLVEGGGETSMELV